MQNYTISSTYSFEMDMIKFWMINKDIETMVSIYLMAVTGWISKVIPGYILSEGHKLWTLYIYISVIMLYGHHSDPLSNANVCEKQIVPRILQWFRMIHQAPLETRKTYTNLFTTGMIINNKLSVLRPQKMTTDSSHDPVPH